MAFKPFAEWSQCSASGPGPTWKPSAPARSPFMHSHTSPCSILGLVDAVFSAWQTASQPSLPSAWTSPHTLMPPHQGPDSFPRQASLVAQMVKNLLAVWETQVQSLGREDPLEKEMATHSSFLFWKIPWMEEPGRLQSMGSQRVRYDWVTSLSFPIMALTPFLIAQFWGLQGLAPFLGYEVPEEKQPTTVNVCWAFPMCQIR